VALTKRHYKQSPSEERSDRQHVNKVSSTNIRFEGNKSMIEPTDESFLPSLTRNISLPKKINDGSNYLKRKDGSVTEPYRSKEASPRSDASDRVTKKPNVKGLRISGDKSLQKRIMYLKDSLEKNPHLNGTEDIQNQFKSAVKIFPSEMISPKESSLSHIVKISELPSKKNFFQTPSVNSLTSQTMLKNLYDSDKERIWARPHPKNLSMMGSSSDIPNSNFYSHL